MKILVAGGAGYVGSVLVPMLQARGHDVTVADACWFGNHLPANTPLVQRDLFALDEKSLAGYEQVIFLAGLSNDPMAEYDPALNFVQNAALPAYLAYCARRAGVWRFVYGSSCSIYGHADERDHVEGDPSNCAFPYGVSKLQGEQGALQQANGEFSVIALRQGTVNGHSPRMRFDLIVNTMFRAAVLEGRITVSHPGIWRPIIDVRDTSGAFINAVDAPAEVTGIFNVALGNFTVAQVAEAVAMETALLTGRQIDIDTQYNPDLRNYRVDTGRARQMLGFAPQYGVVDMVRSLHAHLEDYGDLNDDNYYNIRVFRKMHPGR
jgi:nucleoside-diphosphate-sugar epimerase